jgi:hypothetical protein
MILGQLFVGLFPLLGMPQRIRFRESLVFSHSVTLEINCLVTVNIPEATEAGRYVPHGSRFLCTPSTMWRYIAQTL